MFLQWNTTVAKIVRSNILASNGIIHIIDKLFVDLPEVPTTVSPDGTTKKSSHVNSAVFHCSLKSLALIILSFCVLFFSWFYMLILINYIFVYHLFVIIHGRDNDMITSIYKFIKSWWPLRLWLWVSPVPRFTRYNFRMCT